jgi:superfamily II DNA or RNA helicase
MIIKTGRYAIPKTEITPQILSNLKSKFSYWNPDKEILKHSYIVTKTHIEVPRNYKKLIVIFGKNLDISDQTTYPDIKSPFKLSDTFSLKDSQKVAMGNMTKALVNSNDNSAILKAEPGFGKSYTLPYLVKQLNTNTLIIVDRTNLAIQMQGEFLNNCSGIDLTILGGKNREVASVTITTFQFLIKNLDFIKQHKDFFGLVVVDEAHVVGSDVFTIVVGEFNAKFRIGLSATPTRSDHMTPLLEDVMGTIRVDGVGDNNLNVHLINVWNEDTAWFGYGKSYKEVYSKFMTNGKVSPKICEITKNLLRVGRRGLLYTTEVLTQEHYEKVFTELGIRVGVVNQKTKQEDRQKIFSMMESDEIDIIISGSILQKGISIKRLDYIINLSNLTKEGHEQVIGRLRRHHESKKTPLFIDMLFQGSIFDKCLERVSLSSKLAERFDDKCTSTQYEKMIDKLRNS